MNIHHESAWTITLAVILAALIVGVVVRDVVVRLRAKRSTERKEKRNE